MSIYNEGHPGSIPGSGRSPGEGNGTPPQYSSWRIPWMEEPGGLQSTGSQRVGHDCATLRHFIAGEQCGGSFRWKAKGLSRAHDRYPFSPNPLPIQAVT